MTFTAAEGSVYRKSTGGTVGPGQPVVESVLILPDDEDTQIKEARFDLGWQEIQLVLEGAGSGVVHHSEVGVVCPPSCTIRYWYGETGVIVVAVPDPGSFFKSWSGPCAGQGAGCQFDMPKSTTMTVTFGLTPTAATTPRPATPRPATPKPTVVPSAASTPEPSPSPAAPSTGPTETPGASDAPATGGAPTAPVATAAPSAGPIDLVDTEGGFGSGLLAAGIVAAIGGLVFWRRRTAGV
jgi:hypothetical protein